VSIGVQLVKSAAGGAELSELGTPIYKGSFLLLALHREAVIGGELISVSKTSKSESAICASQIRATNKPIFANVRERVAMGSLSELAAMKRSSAKASCCVWIQKATSNGIATNVDVSTSTKSTKSFASMAFKISFHERVELAGNFRKEGMLLLLRIGKYHSNEDKGDRKL
jgi:hypothetical protein